MEMIVEGPNLIRVVGKFQAPCLTKLVFTSRGGMKF